MVGLRRGTLVLKPPKDGGGPLDWVEDFIVHELTHARQVQLEREHGWKRTRGDHRDLGWYAAVAEACPRYLGFELPPSIWPQGPRKKEGRLTEVEMTHWPESIRMLAMLEDQRLPLRSRVDVRRFGGAVDHELMCNIQADSTAEPEVSNIDVRPSGPM